MGNELLFSLVQYIWLCPVKPVDGWVWLWKQELLCRPSSSVPLSLLTAAPWAHGNWSETGNRTHGLVRADRTEQKNNIMNPKHQELTEPEASNPIPKM